MFDIAVCDDMEKSVRSLFFWKKWLCGAPMQLKRKGLSAYLKRYNVPTVILSNYSPTEVFGGCSPQDMSALLCRLTVVQVDDNFIDMNGVVDFN